MERRNTKMKIKTKENLMGNLLNQINNITEIENEIFSFTDTLDKINNQIMDILHYIENEEITTDGAIKIITLLKDLRVQRREVKQMWEIWNTYGKHKEKLKNKESRQFLVAEIKKVNKGLQTTYKYRDLKIEQLNELNDGSK